MDFTSLVVAGSSCGGSEGDFVSARVRRQAHFLRRLKPADRAAGLDAMKRPALRGCLTSGATCLLQQSCTL